MSAVIITDLESATLAELHHRAMAICDQAIDALREGDHPLSKRLYGEAFVYEVAAARRTADRIDFEPTRSVLHRSAATMAMQAGRFPEAEHLIYIALSGNPPHHLAEELKDLLDQLHFERHLELRGIRLAANEFQFAIAGDAIGKGIAPSEEFVGRVRATEKIVFRTMERKSELAFRDAGRVSKDIAGRYELFLSVPRAASFAVTFRVGLPADQSYLPGIDLAPELTPSILIDNVFECLQSFNEGDFDRLKRLIPQQAYYRNFVGLARQLAPDGDRVKMVGFTAHRGNSPTRVALDRRRADVPSDQSVEAGTRVEVRGRLLFADSAGKSNRIKIIDDDGARHSFRVPEGLMADIVKPLWEDRVVVYGINSGKSKVDLERIEKMDD